jgi:integrase
VRGGFYYLETAGFRSMAVGTALSHDCYLRVSEMTEIRKKDVTVPGDARLDGVVAEMSIRLKSTKTGPNQFVTVRHPQVVALMLRLIKDTPGGGKTKLFDFKPAAFRYRFKKTCKSLGLKAKYVPHSLRHGGATMDALLGMALEDVLLRGRWASTVSTRRYIQSGRALMLQRKIPKDVSDFGELAAKHLHLL